MAIFYIFYLLILETEEGRGKEKHWFSHIFMYSLVDFCTCPDQGLNPQPWRIRTMLQTTELPSQGLQWLFLIIKLLKINRIVYKYSKANHKTTANATFSGEILVISIKGKSKMHSWPPSLQVSFLVVIAKGNDKDLNN